jgi:hypothetical protein
MIANTETSRDTVKIINVTKSGIPCALFILNTAHYPKFGSISRHP